MIVVRDIFKRVASALGTTDKEVIFELLSDAVEALANKSDWSPLIGYADICVTDKCVVLPREIETILALNIGGTPSFPRDRWFEFHLNGPGSEDNQTCGYYWDDRGHVPTVRNPGTPARLYAVLQEDSDEDTELRVYGYDADGLWIRSKEGDEWRDGYRVPTNADWVVPDSTAPLVSRITRVRKGVSNGHIQLLAHDETAEYPILIGHYQADEINPEYRQIMLARTASWVRIMYRKRTSMVTSMDDAIPLHSRLAIILMARAIHYYDTDRFVDARQYEAAAVRYLEEEQRTNGVPGSVGPQISGATNLIDEHLE